MELGLMILNLFKDKFKHKIETFIITFEDKVYGCWMFNVLNLKWDCK